MLRAEGDDLGADLGQFEEVATVLEKQATGFALPELEGLVLVERGLLLLDGSRTPIFPVVLLLGDVHDVHVVGIDIDRFVAQHQLLVAIDLVAENRDLRIANVQLVFVLDEEGVVVRVVILHFYEEETEFLVVLVRQDVEGAVFLIVDDLFDPAYLKLFIDVHFLFLFQINIEAVLGR